MRTQDEIVNKIKEVGLAGWDVFGTIQTDLVYFLDYEHAKPFLKDETTEESWENGHLKLGDPAHHPSMLIKDYLGFAWDKANSCKGLSSVRSLHHMYSWMWIWGKHAQVTEKYLGASSVYEFYGKPALTAISHLVGFDYLKHDNGCWVNDEGAENLSEPRLAEERRQAIEAAEK